mmetsp:Transcript_12029/g.24579  ORF Transcript_12029/g.24579 Transcript_12029/m.24579 type:complete len:219 (+) Transcript_12029:1-657(+)
MVLKIFLTLILPLLASAYVPPSFRPLNRRSLLSKSFGVGLVSLLTTGTPPVWALEDVDRYTGRMGGLMEKYQDSRGGWLISPPSGWNKFEGEPGAYDVKWQDLVYPSENIKVSSTPVGSDIDSVTKLGGGIEVGELGEKLAKKREGELVSSNARLTDGITFYTFEFVVPKTSVHQLLQLSVSKGKIWSVDANAVGNDRWEKRKEIYSNVLGSFMPKLS